MCKQTRVRSAGRVKVGCQAKGRCRHLPPTSLHNPGKIFRSSNDASGRVGAGKKLLLVLAFLDQLLIDNRGIAVSDAKVPSTSVLESSAS